MEPFSVLCGKCGKSLQVKLPELVGRTVSCPQCKEKIKIIAPQSAEPASESPLPAPAGGDAHQGGIPQPKKAAKKPNPYLIPGGIGALLFILALVIVRNMWNAAEQARTIANLTPKQRGVRKGKAKFGNVRVEVAPPKPVTKPAIKDPEKTPPLPERERVELAETLHGRLQDLTRVHKRHIALAPLTAQLGNLNARYRRENMPLETYQGDLEQLQEKIESTERELVQKQLQTILELNSVAEDLIPALVTALDDAILSTREEGWKDNADVEKKVAAAVHAAALAEQKIERQELADRLMKLAREYY